MTVDPLALIADVDRATARLLDAVAALDPAAAAAPSRLPGWTRGHLVTHVARNADSYTRLLEGARNGVFAAQYPDPARRDPEIAEGAGRDVAALADDLRTAHGRFAEAVRELPAEAWARHIRYLSGAEVPAAHIVWARLREVEVHHVDLGIGYEPSDWSEAFTLRFLHELTADLFRKALGTVVEVGFSVEASDLPFSGAVGGGGAVVRGHGHTLAAWLSGRGDGSGLVASTGGLPPVPRYM
ncbi:maleylpyruvate isomerase [Virgisporangium aliadipatigenens]|uniref:Maleylpyruvate isomerase n=1 Tax=Virgisporangium aliadipatigenens TaxID=741659 RepID=A0A8J3YNL5_9ACTN|nr:maleylpyruvate isomerase family mycothiol-dependent enzyme [Virgisporangium aliadipatigenens]GIJ47403.1 maleylpyruvate isomerase [Virgisporangium aliadipatigenens]